VKAICLPSGDGAGEKAPPRTLVIWTMSFVVVSQAKMLKMPVVSDEKKSLFARVSVMTVVQRIRLAYRGNKEERMFLVQDRNRLVSAAALKSPKTREADAEAIANMKSVSEDVLRSIAFRRDWMRHYGILRSLVRNPRSPVDVTLGLVMKLNARDVKQLAGDRNVPEALRLQARKMVVSGESRKK